MTTGSSKVPAEGCAMQAVPYRLYVLHAPAQIRSDCRDGHDCQVYKVPVWGL